MEKPVRSGCLLLSMAMAMAVGSQARAQVTIPSSLVGSYDLTMDANAQSPIADGATADIEISEEGTLCADGIELSGFTRDASPGFVYWVITGSNLEFSLNTGSPFTGLGVTSASGTAYGTLEGTRVDPEPGICGEAALIGNFFDLAEDKYPEYFPASIFVFTQKDGGTSFRYYPATDIYLSVLSTGQARVTGGDFGVGGSNLGNIEDIVDSGELTIQEPGTTPSPSNNLDFRVSTYELTLENAAPFSPIPTGTTLTFVLTKDYRLCVGELVLSPSTQNGITVWNNPGAGYYYAFGPRDGADDFDWEQRGAFTLFDSRGLAYGEFQGDRVSLDAECGDRLGEPSDLEEIKLLLGLLEQRMPTVYPGGPQTFSRRTDGTVYRHYNESGVTVYVQGRDVSAQGGPHGAGTYLGELGALIKELREQSLPVTIPSEVVGSYGLSFTASGPSTQPSIPSSLDLSLDQFGNLCVDGTMLMNPYLSPDNPDLIVWESTDGGFALMLDSSALAPNALSMELKSTEGVLLGTMSGNKTLGLPVCRGLLGNGVSFEDAQYLFEGAERHLPADFPPSALTYSRVEGSKLLRYYPASAVLVSIENGNVAVSGGSFGAAPVTVGSVEGLKRYFADNFGFSQQGMASLNVQGLRFLTIANLPTIEQQVDIDQTNAVVPTSTDQASLLAAVRQALSGELRGGESFNFDIVVDDGDRLIFDAELADEVGNGFAKIRRQYVLRFSYDR